MMSAIARLKDAIRARDGYKCVDCGLPQSELARRGIGKQRRLQVHRIIPDGPYSFENCKTVCSPCHCAYRRDYAGRPKIVRTEHPDMPIEDIRELIRTSFRGSYTSLAVALTISENNVTAWLNGRRHPSAEQVALMRNWLREAREEVRKQPA